MATAENVAEVVYENYRTSVNKRNGVAPWAEALPEARKRLTVAIEDVLAGRIEAVPGTDIAKGTGDPLDPFFSVFFVRDTAYALGISYYIPHVNGSVLKVNPGSHAERIWPKKN